MRRSRGEREGGKVAAKILGAAAGRGGGAMHAKKGDQI